VILRGRNPRTGEEGAAVLATSPEQTAGAVAAAAEWHAAHPHPSAESRRQVLEAMAHGIDAERQALVSQAEWETALGVGRLSGEIDRTITQIRMFSDLLGSDSDAMEESTAPSPRGDGTTTTISRLTVPIGPVAVWAASNFPFAFGIPGGDTVSALAAGCPVIVKAHPSQPSTSELLSNVLREALSSVDHAHGILSVVHGDAAADVLVSDKRMRAGAFTGSHAGGTALARRALGRAEPMPFFAEMGGVNPAVVLPGAARDGAQVLAQGFIQSLTLGAGQFCTKPGLLFLPRGCGILDTIMAHLPSDGLPALNGRIASGYRVRLNQLGAPIPPDPDPGQLIPAVMVAGLDDLRREGELLRECFGPFGIVVEYGTGDELGAALSLVGGALVASVFHADDDRDLLCDLMPLLVPRVGRIAFNAWPTGVAVTEAMHHGGPPPASNDPRFTSVGAHAMDRFRRPIALQDAPADVLRAWARPTGVPA
jgi:NADP-dependent aldehyde dehydrogenase